MSIEYHEPPEELRPETRELHRALSTLAEELEAIDWYEHRLDTMNDPDLRDIIVHNQKEEMEHAAMTLEWLRRKLPGLDERLRKYLFKEGPIVEEDAPHYSPRPAGRMDASLGIGRCDEKN